MSTPNNSHKDISISSSTLNTTMGVINFAPPMVQPPTAEEMTNSLQRLIQLGGGINHNSASQGVVPFTGVGPPITQPEQTGNQSHASSPYEKRRSDTSFTQLLPKYHPMNAVPISVSALSHGPPSMSNQQKPAPFSPQTNLNAAQQHAQQQQQLQHGNNMISNQPPSSPLLAHPGQNILQRNLQPQSHARHPQQQQPQQQPPQLMTTIPQQNLSAKKSIISMNTTTITTNTDTNGLTKSGVRVTPPGAVSGVPTTGSTMLTKTTRINTNNTCMITKKQMEERQQSSYSSACNATIRAQQKLSNEQRQQEKRCVIKMEEDENDTRDEVNGSLISNGKAAVTLPCAVSQVTGAGIKRNVDGVPRVASRIKLGDGQIENPDGTIFEPQHKYVQVVGGKVVGKEVAKSPISPHAYLQKLLISRGYSTTHYCSLEGGYYCRPTPLQCASYGLSVVQAVRTSNVQLFAGLLSAGLSRNPCNKFGESILHMVCRRGEYALLKLLIDNGSTIQVSDDFGRTPLHDACWTAKPCFQSIEMLLERDLRLLHIVDCRGSPPLEYVKKESWGSWIDFFEQKKEIYWPQRNLNEVCEECPPELVNVPPHSRPVLDPKNCASLESAAMYANGKKELLQ